MGHAFDGRGVGRIGQADPGAHVRAVRRNAFDQRCKGRIKQHHFVFGVVDDVNELLGLQARVAGVHDHAAARDPVIRFQMPVVVPGNGAHRIATHQTQTG